MSEAGTVTSRFGRSGLSLLGLMVPLVVLGFACGHFDLLHGLSIEPLFKLSEGALFAVWDACGIAFVGLVPLAIWLLRLMLKYLVLKEDASAAIQLDLAFISRNGPLLGLLGTVVALASAGATLAVDVESGAASAVLGVIPLVGQALLSTIAGIILAVGADTTLHVIERSDLRSSDACGELK